MIRCAFVCTCLHVCLYRYYNAWIETYAEQEYKHHSGTNLSDQSDEDSDLTESEEDSRDHAEDVSIEFRNETSSSESSDSSNGSDFSDTDSNASEDDEDSFVVKFESSAIMSRFTITTLKFCISQLKLMFVTM